MEIYLYICTYKKVMILKLSMQDMLVPKGGGGGVGYHNDTLYI